MMIRVDTLDRFSSEHRVVGYALLAIFMDPSGNQVWYTSVSCSAGVWRRNYLGMSISPVK